MTAFVINLAKPYLMYMNSSLIDYGHPRGLIALILASVSLLFLVLFCQSNNEFSWNVLFVLLKKMESVKILALSTIVTMLLLRSISKVSTISISGQTSTRHAVLLILLSNPLEILPLWIFPR
jgi:hypothetical protein